MMKEAIKCSMLIFALVFFMGCDQLTKEYARRELSFAPMPTHMLGVVRFEYAENPGSFMSIGATLPESFRWFIHVMSAVIVFPAKPSMTPIDSIVCSSAVTTLILKVMSRPDFDPKYLPHQSIQALDARKTCRLRQISYNATGQRQEKA